VTNVRVGVIGTGSMGADHIRTLSTAVAGVTVAAVSDVDTGRAATAVSGLPDTRISDDPLALITGDDVDAVIVASADPTHEEFVNACLSAEKPVLCEKPLTPTTEGGSRIVAAEVAVGRRLVSVGFMRRYDPGYVRLARVLASGALGSPLLLHCVHRNAGSRPDVPSAHLLTGSGVHEVDIARWLLDEEIVRITVHHGRASSRVVGRTQDPLFVVMETESGVLVDVEIFVNCQYGYEVRCELVGESGTMTLDQPVGVLRRSAGLLSSDVPPSWDGRFADAYREELRDWVAGVACGEQRGATAWDGYVATEVVVAAARALETGTPTTVQLPARPDLYK
jgi:myo-inositol 2-dehydrogenase/D-chiro-inositol 1-dehydrogenase